MAGVVVAWCETYGRFEERTGERKPAADYELQCERRLHEALDVLWGNPASRLKMGLDVARASQFDLARHWAESELERRRGRGGGPGVSALLRKPSGGARGARAA